ncbi:type II CRISPR RNA-guided endonuclease Cas9 [Echinicola salinicaeni]|uniref:type II CRISPR RNA-guided endonuclease Cas9 n=1 Tax=Echinicola salinicaeni TaxID=2762757 RepID=UPI001648430A|nr:type II CRISPR RNA-guided endonuclease Cas9 [Echinicola salinicaeni]
MKRILGLDLGTNSIGWALIQHDFENKDGRIQDIGSRIIPMGQDILGKFEAGQSISQTAERTDYRGIRRLYQRDKLRRERLHRVLNLLGFLPQHYADAIDFDRKLGQFKPETEVKLNYIKNADGKYEFIFKDSFDEMLHEFKATQPHIFQANHKGKTPQIPYDWTIYYLRKKALSKAISKEELAWVILNFNQKRGYYQLRGEDLDEDKNKQFVQLKVKEVIDTGEKVKGKSLYDVLFENGWKYDRQITKTEDWIGRTKEFIVTISTLNSGETKYSYKAVDSEKDWAAIKAKTERDIENSQKTVGEFIYETLLDRPNQKIRGELVKTIERKFYKEEFKKIISKQVSLQPDLFSRELYQACIEELYPRNEAHQSQLKDQDFIHLFSEDIIFYQRPLKSKKSDISACPYEFRVFKKKDIETGETEIVHQGVKAIPKSHPLFQEFRLWQWLHNIRIHQKNRTTGDKIEIDVDITSELLKTEEDWSNLFDFMTSKREVEQKHIIKYFIDKGLLSNNAKDNYRWNYVEDKKYPAYDTRSQFISRLKKIKGIEPTDFLTEKTCLGKNNSGQILSREEQLWHIIYSVTDKKEYQSALGKFAQKHGIDVDPFVEAFIKFPPFDSDYGSYSKKAINKLLPLMRRGKYWDENAILDTSKERIDEILERVNSLKLKEGYSKKELAEKLEKVSDDDIPKQVVKSFVPLSNQPYTGLNTYQACYAVYGRHSEVGDIQYWRAAEDIDLYLKGFKQHSLRNPIVEQVVCETLRVVRDIWKKQRSEDPHFQFDEIHLELGREMKNSAEKRKQLSDKINENENTNHRIKEILKELTNDPMIEGDVRSYSPGQQEILKLYEEGIYQNPNTTYDTVSEDEIKKIRRNNNPSKSDILRYKLWLEQGYISPYTGKPIQLSKLFTTAYQIEHIIPQSRYFDNSFGNKVICESAINEDKDNKTAYEYLKAKGGSIVDGHLLFKLDEYEAHVSRYFKRNKTKLKNLLSEDIPEGFINRQLNDSRYISKLVKGLLSNIVRENNEKEATSKNLIPVNGAITSKLKNDWGLNDKWNELITPRFQRLNELTKSKNFGFWDKDINAYRIQVPDEISKGFNKKRIDHRHHALDALVTACTTRNHTHYLNALNAEKKNHNLRSKLLIQNEHGHYTKTFQMPWSSFPVEAKNKLETTIISFKQNLRVINKANNKFWSYKDVNGNLNIGKNGKPEKKLRKQNMGDHWAIRKSLHKETVSGIVNGIDVPKDKIAVSVRTSLTEIKTQKHIDKIVDSRIRNIIIPNHLKNYIDEKGKINFPEAFSPAGIEDLNENITHLNEGKPHQPILKVKLYEVGNKFQIGETDNKSKKYVEAAKGTNLFFAIYWDEKKQKRTFETVPLNEVIEHQKQVAHLPKSQRTPIQSNPNKGKLLFTLSPNDLVYVPTEEENENPGLIDFSNLNKDQASRIYKMVSSTGNECHFIQASIASLIKKYDTKSRFGEMGSLNKLEITIDIDAPIRIKENCIKIKVDRLGNIQKSIL